MKTTEAGSKKNVIAISRTGIAATFEHGHTEHVKVAVTTGDSSRDEKWLRGSSGNEQFFDWVREIVRLAFCMTENKSHGQTFEGVELTLHAPVFAHGTTHGFLL
ncbi:hypothetical protein ANCCEY_13853 [Ancylostoma ceylanicum]|uniref:Uncharacterized protein n=1 Tax=Ancylostoma ceylanicum TaxID=53326 RepID=A0A0D6L636_9BILA|nr:hypothetical protein ANCCEY_13853 [Ancylostoma ceylanicum]